MNRNYPNFDNIDAYLKNKLSNAERSDFEHQLRQDPLLQGEVNLQREIVNSLSSYRKAELKARLNAIPVENTPFWYSSTAIKWISGGLATVSLGLIAYLYIPEIQNDNQELAPVVQLDQQSKTLNQTDQLSVPKPIETETLAVEAPSVKNKITTILKQESAPTEIVNSQNVIQNTKKESSESITLPEIVRPEISQHFDDSFQDKEIEDPEVPVRDFSTVNDSRNKEAEIQNITDSKLDFHYKYFENKLFLYGDFKGIPYEILALNNNNGTRLYLSYNDQFYIIERNQEEPLPLVPIQNPQLINELNIIRNYK